MQDSNIPYKFSSIWAAGATAGFITPIIPATVAGAAASQVLGFPTPTAQPVGAGGTPPNIADFNGLGNYLTAWAQWQQAGAPVFYDAPFSSNIGGYPKGAVLSTASETGAYWISTVDNNTTDPDTGGAGWLWGGRPHVLSVSSSINLPAAQILTIVAIGGNTSYTQTMPAPASFGGSGFLINNYGTASQSFTTATGAFSGPNGNFAATITIAAGSSVNFISDGVNWVTYGLMPAGGWQTFSTINAITSGSGTFTVPDGKVYIKVTCIGASGGGGSSGGGSGGGGGGGGGGYAATYFAVTAGQTFTYSVGMAGTAGVAGAGGAGGATTFGSLIANGGAGGATGASSQNAGGVGGTVSGGLLEYAGASGQNGVNVGGTAVGGAGGAVFGGVGAYFSLTAGYPPAFPGCGGGGAGGGNGAAGYAGLITVEY
jgi:hypothetical protein